MFRSPPTSDPEAFLRDDPLAQLLSGHGRRCTYLATQTGVLIVALFTKPVEEASTHSNRVQQRIKASPYPGRGGRVTV